MKIYFLSGLGADKTVFQFLDTPYYEPVFIDWIPPFQNESLPAYAKRLQENFIPNDSIVIGLSFGGMLATEMAKLHPTLKTILISSAKTSKEIPGFYQLGKFLPIHQAAPGALHKWFMLRAKWLFGLKDPASVYIYETLIKNSDPVFNRWAINALLNWNNSVVPDNLVHIHGTHDKILPYKNVHCNYTIKKGEHLMVMDKAGEVSTIIRQVLEEKFSLPNAFS